MAGGDEGEGEFEEVSLYFRRIKKLDLKYGLYFTVLYDIGGVWFKDDNLKKVRFRSGTGIGLNFILPFGYVLRADWAFRIAKPTVGEINLSLNAKF